MPPLRVTAGNRPAPILKIIFDLGDSRGPYITSQASDAGAFYGMAGVLRSRLIKDRRSGLSSTHHGAAHSSSSLQILAAAASCLTRIRARASFSAPAADFTVARTMKGQVNDAAARSIVTKRKYLMEKTSYGWISGTTRPQTRKTQGGVGLFLQAPPLS